MTDAIKHRLPGRQYHYLAHAPENLRLDDKIAWCIGSFMIQLSTLESDITDWVSTALMVRHEIYTHVIFRETNVSQKIRVIKFLHSKKMTFNGDFKNAISIIEKANLHRNYFAHGALFIKDEIVEISMPSTDGLRSNARIRIGENEICDLIEKISCVSEEFVISKDDHIKNFYMKK